MKSRETSNGPSESLTVLRLEQKIEQLEQQSRAAARSEEMVRQRIISQSNERIDALEQKARDLADFVEALRNKTQLQSETDIEALGQKARDLALSVERASKETRLQSETEIAALGLRARELAVVVETVREETLLNSDNEIAALGQQARDLAVTVEQSRIDTLVESERVIRKSEERYRTLIVATTAIVWDMAPAGEFMAEQRPWTAFTGQTFDQLRGWGWLSAVHPDDRERTSDLWKAAVAGQTAYQAEHRLRRADGVYRQMSVRCIPIQEPGGGIREWVGVHTDVTDQRRTEAEREALLSRLQLHIERMPLAYILFDSEFRITEWNPTAERIFGYSREEMLGTGPPHAAFVPRSQWENGEDNRKRVRAGDMEAHSLNENLTKDGRTIMCECLNTPLTSEGGQFIGTLCLARDVTEQRSLESQIRQSQKMDAFGQLASGVAHDFNNLLTIISGYSELILTTIEPHHPMCESVKQINVAGHRAASLTRQLLAFSRKTVLEPKVLDLNDSVREAAKLLLRLIGEDILFSTILDPTISRVKVDPGLLGQVLMNLALNARDAMPQGGRLTIETSDLQLDEDYAAHHSECKPGRYVKLTVSDSGCGMSPEVRAHVFEPFFTTKGPGKGTGLGLATVYGIIKQSGGSIDLYTEPGRGTVFKVYLPAVDERLQAQGTDQRVSLAAGGTETVLVVEDEDAVRAIAVRALEIQGYTVLQADNGVAALGIVERHPGQISLLVTDVVMPGMSGRELAETLLARHSGLKVLFVSGYTDDAVIRHGILQVEVAFLQKPYTPLSLARKAREVLDKRLASEAVLSQAESIN